MALSWATRGVAVSRSSAMSASKVANLCFQEPVVSMLGVRFFHALNSLKRATVPAVAKAPAVPAFAGGGLVTSGVSDVLTLNLVAGDTKVPLKVLGKSGDVRRQLLLLQKEFSKLRLSHG